jgi:hypothetical protein
MYATMREFFLARHWLLCAIALKRLCIRYCRRTRIDRQLHLRSQALQAGRLPLYTGCRLLQKRSFGFKEP